MMRKAILHIGAHKTGTTAIQKTLLLNAASLQDSGVTYPVELTRSEMSMFGQHAIAYALLGENEFAIKTCGCARDPLDHVRGISREHDVILSSENFLRLDADAIAKLRNCLAGFQVEVVLYVRRQDESCQGLFQTDVVYQQYARPFEDWFQDNRTLFDYWAIACRWRDVFGADRIHVRVYEKSHLTQGDSVADFCAVVESLLVRPVSAAISTSDDGDLYHGLPEHIVFMIHYYNQRPQRDKVVPMLRQLAGKLYRGGHGRYELIAPSGRRAILSAFSHSNEMLGKEYLGEDVSALWTEPEDQESNGEWHEKYSWDGSHLRMLAVDMIDALKGSGTDPD